MSILMWPIEIPEELYCHKASLIDFLDNFWNGLYFDKLEQNFFKYEKKKLYATLEILLIELLLYIKTNINKLYATNLLNSSTEIFPEPSWSILDIIRSNSLGVHGLPSALNASRSSSTEIKPELSWSK